MQPTMSELASRCCGAKALKLGAAQLFRCLHFGPAAAAPHGIGVERHRVLAGAQKNVFGALYRHIKMKQGCRAALAPALHPL